MTDIASAMASLTAPTLPVTPQAILVAPGRASILLGAHNLLGGAQDDQLTGTQDVDVIVGFGGADGLQGLGGADWLEGGVGNDTLYGGSGDDILWGGLGSDDLYGGAGADVFILKKGETWDVIHDFDPSQGDVLKLYGFASAAEYSLEAIDSADTLIRFQDGSGIVLKGITLAELTAAPNAIRIEAGSGPAATQTPAGASITVTTTRTIGYTEFLGFEDNVGIVLEQVWPNAGPSLYNHGLIYVTSAEAYVTGVTQAAVGDYDSAVIQNEADGVLLVSGRNEGAASTAMGVTGGNIVNHGYIEVYGNFFATGASATLSFVNTGDIYVTAYGFAYGYTASSGSFDNSGLIDVAGGVNGVGVVLSNTATFNNSGVIRAISYSGNASIGVLLDWVYRPYGPYVNSGLIEADYAFKLAVNPDGGPEAESVEVIFNTGQIHGAIDLAFGDDIIHNDGEISGQTFLADGNDLYDGLLGTHLGQIIGGVGNDTLLGGAGAETFYGELDSDTILGGGGNDVIDGGPGADLLDGGAGFDTLSYLSSDIRVVVDLVAETAYAAGVDRVRGFERVVGSRFGDTLSGAAGAETFEGNAGDDTISAGAGGDTLVGGLGADTLTGGAGNDLFVFSIGDGADVVTDFQAGGSDDQLRIYGFTAYQSLTQQGADTLVRLSATDSILLRNVLASALTNADFQFSATALAAAPTASGLHNTVLVASDFQVFAGEVVTFEDVAFGIYSNSGRTTSIYNGGVIRVSGDTPYYEAVAGIDTVPYMNATRPESVLYNQASGVIDVVATGEGGANAIIAPIDFYNAGLVRVVAATAANGIRGGNSVFGYKLVNAGDIEVTGTASAYGIRAESGVGADTSIWNSGHITATGSGLSIGGLLGGRFGTVVNSGTLRVIDSSAALDGCGLDMTFSAGFSVFNSGTIEADYVILDRFTTYSAPTFVNTVVNSGQMRGRVSLDQGRDQVFNTGAITGPVQLGAWDDLYDGRGGSQTGGVFGGGGDDILLGGSGADRLDGGDGLDTLSGGGGVDTLTGGQGDDSFVFAVGSGADTITDFTAGGTEDVIRVTGYAGYQSATQQGADTLVRFSATDSLLLRGVTASALTATDFLFSAPALTGLPTAPTAPVAPTMPTPPTGVTPVYPVIGGGAAETLRGSAAGELIEGQGGADWIFGLGGDDRLKGGSGADRFVFSTGAGADTILDFKAGQGDEIWLDGVSASSVLRNGADVDVTLSDGSRIKVQNATVAQVQAALHLGSPGTPPTLTVSPPPPFSPPATPPPPPANPGLQPTPVLPLPPPAGAQVGDQNANTFTGGAGADFLDGGEGDDVLTGQAGNDYLNGGWGNDTLWGGAGDDTLMGWFGFDWAVYTDATQSLTIDLRIETPQNTGQGVDTLIRIEWIDGSNFADTIYGNEAENYLRGNGGSDVLYGFGGADLLEAGAGLTNDRLEGGDGDDGLSGSDGDNVLVGGRGGDRLTGGGGADIFVFAPGEVDQDRITDFQVGLDRLDLTAWSEAPTVSQSDLGALLTFSNGEVMVLYGVQASQLTAADFILPDTPQPPPVVYGRTLTGSAVNDSLAGDGRNEQINGLAGDDQLSGAGGLDRLDGGLGNDVLSGGAGADLIIGGAGVDTVSYASSASAVSVHLFDNTLFGGDANGDVLTDVENVTGSAFNDDLMGSAGANVLTGGAGADQLQGLAGDDILIGGAGGDSMAGGEGIDTASYAGSALAVYVRLFSNSAFGGDAGGDVLTDIENATGSANNDDLMGSAGANVLTGGAGADQLQGLAGDDLLIGGAGADTLNGGDGIDTISFAGSSAGVYVRLFNNTAFGGDANGDVISNVENASGSSNNDDMMGSGAANGLDGGAGADRLNGLAGDDLLTGGAGGDILTGGDGTDTASYAGSAQAVTVNLLTGTASGGDAAGDVITQVENLTGSAFGDVLSGDAGANLLIGGAGADTLNGGDGIDTVSYAGSALAVYVRLFNNTAFGGDANGDVLSNFENATGSANNDDLMGSGDANRLDGGAGADRLNGQAGDDVLTGGLGGDTLIGGDGTDTASYAGSAQAVTVNLLTGATAGGDAAGDVVSQVENLTGSAFGDVLTGDAGANLLIGGTGADTLNGGDGIDTVSYAGSALAVYVRLFNNSAFGGDANGDVLSGVENAVGSANNDDLMGSGDANRLDGGAGADRLNGLAGDDVLTGGAGADSLTGGAGADRFVFTGASGSDTISDFVAGAGAGDVIQLSTALFATFADVLASTADDGLGNTVISKSGVTITLTGVLESQLAADDFVFAAPAAPVATASTAAAAGIQVDPGGDPWGRALPPAGSDLVELAGAHAPDHPVAISPLDIMGRLSDWRPAAAWDYDWVA